MEQIAARYIEEMIAVRPQGPWAIGGWSMGGVIAFEMARQLYAQGQPPHAVVIVDAYAPWVVSWRERLRVHLAAFRRRPWRGRAGYLAQRITNRMNVLGRKVGIESISAGLDGELAARVRKSTLAQFEALSCYQPRPLEANIVLLRAEQTEHVGDPRSTDVNLGWNTLVNGHIDTVPIPGCHTGIFQRGNVEVLAETLSARLA